MFGKVIIAAAFAVVAFAQLKVESPASLITCQPALLSWSGGQGPYFLAAIPGGQPTAAAIKDFGQQTGNSLTWNVDLPAGTSVTIRITDSTGATNYNSAVTIQAGSTACIGASSSGVAATGAGVASSAAASAASSAAAVTSSLASAVSSASRAVASATSAAAASSMSAMSMASGASSSGVRASAASAASGASSAVAGAASGAVSAAASVRPSGAASLSTSVNAGVFAVVLGAIGVAAF